jgi:hypothetical protein
MSDLTYSPTFGSIYNSTFHPTLSPTLSPNIKSTTPPYDGSVAYIFYLVSALVMFALIFCILLVKTVLLFIGYTVRVPRPAVVVMYNNLGARLPLSEQQFAVLREFPYNKVSTEDEPEECSVCLGTFCTGDCCRTLPAPCGHTFHKDCIDEWFTRNSTCPLCKRSVYELLQRDENAIRPNGVVV